jgi:hypothetical protein
MRHQVTRRVASTGILGVMLLMTIGCTATTRVAFNGPPGSVLFVDDKPYHLPTTIEFTRPAGSSGSTQHSALLAYSLNSQEVRAAGDLEAFAYTESDVDKVAIVTCNLDEQHLAKIPYGTTLIFKGQTASRQPCFELTLKLK